MLLRTCQHRFRWPSLFAMLLLLVMPLLSQWQGAAAMPHAMAVQAHCAKAVDHCEKPAPHLPTRGHAHDACGYCPLVAGLVQPTAVPTMAVATAVDTSMTAHTAGIAPRRAPSTGLGSRGPPRIRVA